MKREFPSYLNIAPEVRDALESGRPVVALESTVISHGLPWPENRTLARRLEGIVRAAGAVPATIGILSGQVMVGLDEEGIGRLAQGGSMARKVSRRDLALVQARRQDGATTVAGTIWLAEQAGISVMATGGIGGVHRAPGAAPRAWRTKADALPPHLRQSPVEEILPGHSYDVSADLPEIARTRVAVVCAGAKAILDLPATREWLETSGVPVLGYRTEEFPAFYSVSSGLPVDETVLDAREAAEMARLHWSMGLGGVLVVVPPPEAYALDFGEMEAVIDQAIHEAERAGVHGKDLTPFLLARVSELTGGRSRAVNLALLENNAAVGAQMACALATPQ